VIWPVLALQADPFYQSVTVDLSQNVARRRSALAHYSSLSIDSGRRIGRCVHLEDPALGVAVWHLPQTSQAEAEEAKQKRFALAGVLG
jgi:hypothetical protein